MNGRNIKADRSGSAARARMIAAVAVVLLLLAGATVGAQTKHGTGQWILTGTSNVGFVPGQSLRVNVINPEQPRRAGRPASARAKVFSGVDGSLLGLTPDAEVPAGESRTFEISRNELAAAGEPRTGRLQVRVEVEIEFDAPREESEGAQRGISKNGVGTMMLELVDDDSGKTTMALLLPAVQWVREAASR